MPKAPINKQKPGKKQNGYNFPEKLTEGEILKDVVSKKEWIIGPSIGKGGFGEIYSASENSGRQKNFSFAVKIEPHENGPLFMEKNLYKKIAKLEDVENWKKTNNKKHLGMPVYYGSGSHTFKDLKYRFMIMEKYGKDLWTIFLNSGRKFPPSTVYRIALQVLDVLNYIHDRDYIHGDIKGSNLLLGTKKGSTNNIFLVDFGMASKYSTKEFKKDPKQSHNGTIEYTSCDWHQGVPTRRGDLEILGYNVLQWLNSSLPWEKIKIKEKVHEEKKKLMDNIEEYMKKHFPNMPKVVAEYFKYVSGLKHDERPDYNFCRNLFSKELRKLGAQISGSLEFVVCTKHKIMNKSISETDGNEMDEEDEIDFEETLRKKRKTPPRNRKVNERSSPRKVMVKNTAEKIVTPQKCIYKTPDKKNVTSESEEDIFFTPDEIKNSCKRSLSPRKGDIPKISWRDAPTIRAGSSKAGVYAKKGSNKKLRTK